MVFTKEQADSINQQYAQSGRSERVHAGDRACGCQHSYSMRGVAKYLIKNHRTEFTDQQILDEVAKWKAVFFPGPTVEKVATQQGLIPSQTVAASNGSGSSYNPVNSGIPSQVGGC